MNALQGTNNVVFTKSLEDSQKVYDSWSENYDQHMSNAASCPSPETSKMFIKYAMDTETFLDLGGGTASVVELVREAGYKGTVDILDANLPMLAKANEKDINLRNIIRHYVQEDGILPLKDESYDVVVAAGTFLPNHIPATAVKGVFNVIKKGGLLIMTTRKETTESYKAEFDKCVEELTSFGKVEIVEYWEFHLDFPSIDYKITNAGYVFKRLK